jgi:Phosphatidylinositol-specific phospholipase C, X domain
MSVLPDDLPISEINIPGSHNAAAINTSRPTRWACQAHSITEQLEKGIRLLDIRLKPKKQRGPSTSQPDPAQWDFITCHGHLGLFGANEFQPFDDVLNECKDFLDANPKETIIMTIQIDDWRKTRPNNRPHILQTLQTRIAALPLLTGPSIRTLGESPSLPTLGESRGRIYLINRINDDPALGVPIKIPDNTPGGIISPVAARNYEVYVQDQYKRLNKRHPETHKLRLTIAAFEKKRPGMVLLNFASATKPFGRFVYIMRELLQYISQQAVSDHGAPNHKSSAQPLGWLFLDYPFTIYDGKTPDLPTLIIASNFTTPAHPLIAHPPPPETPISATEYTHKG